MRIHNIIKTVCLAGSLALLSACEDWLEIEPKDRFGDTTVWGSEENADMFLNDIYNQLPHLNNETQNLDQYSDNSYVGAEWMNARTTIYTGALSPTSWIPGPWDMWKWGRQNNDDAKGQYERTPCRSAFPACLVLSLSLDGVRWCAYHHGSAG